MLAFLDNSSFSIPLTIIILEIIVCCRYYHSTHLRNPRQGTICTWFAMLLAKAFTKLRLTTIS